MAGGSDLVWILKPQDNRALSMINAPTIRLSFRVHFIPLNGPANDPEVRVLLVETANAQSIYEASGTWAQCRRWVVQISGCVILADQFAAIQKRLEMKSLATIKEVQVSLCALESVGFRRADGQA
jgi:hypothetical protein